MRDRLTAHRFGTNAARPARLAVLCALALFTVLVVGPAAAEHTIDPTVASPDLPDGYAGSYSYVRVLEGSATLTQGDNGDRDQLQVNQPILVGDRIWVAPRSRVEVVLSDRNILRVDAGSEVVFDSLAGSPDRQDPLTVLRVPQGNVQLVVVSDFLGDGLPRIDTPNTTIYAYDVGSLRVTTDSGDWTEVVAREGSAEVVTRRGSFLIDRDDEAVIEGDRDPRDDVREASRLDSLELWGERLDREARYAEAPYVDDSLQYEAASLDRYGSWVTIEGRQAWRPRVAADWRPYWNGRWSHSPLGYTWVSYEPWGWVPYHYGTWDYVPGYGWSWFPGVQFAPAWVYWYWTDAYVGWVPAGYYTHFYHPLFGADAVFRWGVYGWTDGRWGAYHDWNFCDLRYFGDSHQHHHIYRGDRFAEHSGYAVPRRGIVTTDTRGLDHVATRRGQEVVDTLARRTRPGRDGSLPDVTRFVARERAIGRNIQSLVTVDRSDAGAGRPSRMIADESRQVREGTSGSGARSRNDVDTTAADRARRIESIRQDLPTAARRTPTEETVRSGSDRSDQVGRVVPQRTPTGDATRRTDAIVRDREVDRRQRADEIRRALPVTPRGSVDGATREGSRGSGRTETESSWRERTPVVPDRTQVQGREQGRTQGQSQGGTRDEATRRDPQRGERISIPRRVIEGVRSTPREIKPPTRMIETTRERTSTTTRSESAKPPPRSSSTRSTTSSRSQSSSSRSSVSHRSSSSSRSGSSAHGRSGGSTRSSSSSSARSRSHGKPPM